MCESFSVFIDFLLFPSYPHRPSPVLQPNRPTDQQRHQNKPHKTGDHQPYNCVLFSVTDQIKNIVWEDVPHRLSLVRSNQLITTTAFLWSGCTQKDQFISFAQNQMFLKWPGLSHSLSQKRTRLVRVAEDENRFAHKRYSLNVRGLS